MQKWEYRVIEWNEIDISKREELFNRRLCKLKFFEISSLSRSARVAITVGWLHNQEYVPTYFD